MPTWILALNYTLHLLATMIWLGGLATLTLVAWPVLSQSAQGSAPAEGLLFEALERRLRPLANVSLVVLVATGLIQMGGNPNYGGLLQIANLWSLSLLLKHLTVGGMIIISAVIQWAIYPALHRAALLIQHGAPEGETLRKKLHRRMRCLVTLNLVLGVLVLVLTAIMTAL